MNTLEPLIISVAPNGSRARKEENAAVPYTPAEIATEIISAARAGASIAHVHARKPDGSSTQDPATFQEIVERVREHSDIILELSLGSHGFSTDDALGPLSLHPAMATFPMNVRKNTGSMSIAETAQLLLNHNVRPGLAANSAESVGQVVAVIRDGLAGPVPCVVLAPEFSDSIRAATESLLSLTAALPPGTRWWAMKGGAHGPVPLLLRATAIALGGHVRVGFEDTLFKYDDDLPAPSNAWFVGRMVSLAHANGRTVATPAEARTILHLENI
jgi:3-keto-5-aminohexanoate cleavage enzyme